MRILTNIIFKVLIIIILIISIPYLMASIFKAIAFFDTSVPRPEIKHAEFPFKLEYKIDGETISVEDVVVCEFDGIGINAAVGKYRTWKSYILSTGEPNYLIKEWQDEKEYVKLYYILGLASDYMGDVYMGDVENEPIDDDFVPYIYYETKSKNGGRDLRSYPSDEELFDEYGIKLELISFEPTHSIKNSFK